MSISSKSINEGRITADQEHLWTTFANLAPSEELRLLRDRIAQLELQQTINSSTSSDGFDFVAQNGNEIGNADTLGDRNEIEEEMQMELELKEVKEELKLYKEELKGMKQLEGHLKGMKQLEAELKEVKEELKKTELVGKQFEQQIEEWKRIYAEFAHHCSQRHNNRSRDETEHEGIEAATEPTGENWQDFHTRETMIEILADAIGGSVGGVVKNVEDEQQNDRRYMSTFNERQLELLEKEFASSHYPACFQRCAI
ncbi:hypothetical protein GPALN_012009 [Globodera pallida]|nr:hypothetical protein GPALN_012009 [Globodera pallida]